MSFNCANYIRSYLKRFDENSVEKVASVLLENECVTLKQLKSALKPLKATKILTALEKLQNLGLATKSLDSEEIPPATYYNIDVEACIHFSRNGLIIPEIKRKYKSEEAKKLMKLFSSTGSQSVIDVVNVFSLSSDKEKMRQYLDALNDLVSDKLLQLSPAYCERFLVELGSVRHVSIQEVMTKTTRPTQKRKSKQKLNCGSDDEDVSDCAWNVIYCVNNASISSIIQQSAVLSHVNAVCSPDSAQVMAVVMDHFEQKPGELLPIYKLRESLSMDKTLLDDALYLLEEVDSHLKYIDMMGDSIMLNLHEVLESIIVLEICQILLIRHGNDAVKVFNYVYRNPFVDEKELEKLFMGDKTKWAALLTNLCSAFFISKREISKNRMFTDTYPLDGYYCVDLQKLTRCYLTEQAYVSLRYINEAYNAQLSRDAVLLQKMHLVKFVVTNGTTADSNGDISTITEIEQQQMNHLNEKLKKLKSWEVSIQNSLVIYESYLEYRKMRNF